MRAILSLMSMRKRNQINNNQSALGHSVRGDIVMLVLGHVIVARDDVL